jgi:aromatic-L-amino-acid decarboxylase
MENEKGGQSEFSRAPLDMPAEELRAIGHRLVDRIADFLQTMPTGKVTSGEAPAAIRALLPKGNLPDAGEEAGKLLDEATDLMFQHSLFNGHPSFLGYITSSAAPIGALGDFLAAAVNSNVGSYDLSPMATEMERQAVSWIADLAGYPTDSGGVLVSGGNMANFLCFLTGLRAKSFSDIRECGLQGDRPRLRVYASRETHLWIQKAAILFGLGTEAIQSIATDDHMRMDPSDLRTQIEADLKAGNKPIMVIATAGSVNTGAVDPIADLSAICREHNLWFHVDGAYGGFAACLPGAPEGLHALSLADSLAVDPHKWLYIPLEAGCALVKDRKMLLATFGVRRPPYFHFEANSEEVVNYYEYSMQTSRGNRALKVWLTLRSAGRNGYVQMIGENLRLARFLFEEVSRHPELEPFTCDLSLTTFRYVPERLREKAADPEAQEYLNHLNSEILTQLQKRGEVFLSNAAIRGVFLLRSCIVNFRTTREAIRAIPPLVCRIGRELDAKMRGMPGMVR